MPPVDEAYRRLAEIPDLKVLRCAPLARYTRFGVGGPADVFAETGSEETFTAALDVARDSGAPVVVIGAGTNLVVADAGFRGVILRYCGDRIAASGCRVAAQAGAVLQDLVDFSIARGLKGLETLAGIPGSVGAAVYGNAGAYGHSISEQVAGVRFHDGRAIRTIENRECDFRYRESVFKRNREWVVLSVELALEPSTVEGLRNAADEILLVRNRKFPVTMKCAGSIFKNLILKELPSDVAARIPASAVREGKVPAAWFLEQSGAKGASLGGMRVADYHANLIYNSGSGTAAELCALIAEMKGRVRDRFGIRLEEEVQYVG